MGVDNLNRFQLKRVSPFQGLVIDADTWRDAHDYHREQMRLHVLAFHDTGIVEGLSVTASNPPDLSVTIQPGIGVDSDGNMIIVPQSQRYRLQTQKGGPVYLIIQFREVPGEPYQPPDGGQPTRMIDAYRIQERDKPPAEAYLELGRIEFDPAGGDVRDARSSSNPGKNEIDLRHRKSASPPVSGRQIDFVPQPAPVISAPIQPQAVAEGKAKNEKKLVLGHAVLAGGPGDLHTAGLQNLSRELSRGDSTVANVESNVALDKDLSHFSFLYLTGAARFELAAPQRDSLAAYLRSGGTILGDGCSETHGDSDSRGARDFGLAFNQLAGQLNCKLEIVKRGHPLLSAINMFSDVPRGAENAMLLEGGRMIYSGSDYGCAWQGGHADQPLSRDVIRAAFEIGVNIAAYADAKG